MWREWSLCSASSPQLRPLTVINITYIWLNAEVRRTGHRWYCQYCRSVVLHCVAQAPWPNTYATRMLVPATCHACYSRLACCPTRSGGRAALGPELMSVWAPMSHSPRGGGSASRPMSAAQWRSGAAGAKCRAALRAPPPLPRPDRGAHESGLRAEGSGRRPQGSSEGASAPRSSPP